MTVRKVNVNGVVYDVEDKEGVEANAQKINNIRSGAEAAGIAHKLVSGLVYRGYINEGTTLPSDDNSFYFTNDPGNYIDREGNAVTVTTEGVSLIQRKNGEWKVYALWELVSELNNASSTRFASAKAVKTLKDMIDQLAAQGGGSGGGGSVIVDSELSETSLNPVQNAVITAALNELVEAIEEVTAENSVTTDKIADYAVTEKKLSFELGDKINTTKVVADKAAADIGADSITLLQGGIDSDGKENLSSYYLRTGRYSTFKLEVNDGYTIGQLAQYDLAGNFVALYNDYTQPIEGVEWTPTSVVATDKDYMWVAVIFKGNSPTAAISPREEVVKTFVSGLYYYMEGSESDPHSAAQQAKMVVDRTIEQLPNEEDLTLVDEKMQLANRAAAVKDGKVASLGYVILRPDKSFTEQITKPNCIYEIRYEFNLNLNGEEVEIPANCTLKFNGGKLINGTIKGVNSFIDADYTKHIFSQITLTGDWENNTSSPMWYGGKPDTADSSAEIQMCFDDIFRQKFIPKGNWNIKNTLLVRGNTNVDVLLEGENVNAENNVTNITKIITTDDIPIIKVEIQPHEWLAKTFTIRGGMLFANNGSYSSAALIISGNNNSKVISCHLHTTICTTRNSPPNSIGVLIVADDNNTGYVTYVRNHCNIGYFGIGVKSQRGTGAAWITGVQDYSHIWGSRQAVVVENASAFYIGGEYQPGGYFEGDDKTPFIYVDGHNVVIGCKVWDLAAKTEGTHTNNIGVEITETSTNCVFEGLALEMFPFRCIFNTKSLSEGQANIYKPLTTQRYNYGFDPFIENSLVPNKNATIEVNCVDCTISKAENLFNPYAVPPIIKATSEDAVLEITANITEVCLNVLAIAVDINQFWSFKNVKIELYNNKGTLVRTENRNLINGKAAIVSRDFFAFEGEYYEIKKIKITFSGVYKTDYNVALCGIYVKSAQSKINGEMSYRKDIVPTALVNQNKVIQPIELVTGNERHLVIGDEIFKLTKLTRGKDVDTPLLEVAITGNPLVINCMLRLAISKGKVQNINVAIGDYTDYPVIVATIEGSNTKPIPILVKYLKTGTSSAKFQIGIRSFYDKSCVDCISVQGVDAVKPITSFDESFSDLSDKVVQRYTMGDSRPNLSYGDNTGFQFFDTTLSKPIWWTGEKWIDSTGEEV